MKPSIEDIIKAAAREIGFDLVGIAPASLPAEEGLRLQDWVKKGFQGSMHYMENPKRRDIFEVYPWAKSVVSLGVYYLTEGPTSHEEKSGQGRVSSYAWGEGDYHDFMKEKLTLLKKIMERDLGSQCEVASDSFPLLERAYANRAGLGWVGKNTCLIHQGGGSYFFLGEVITSASLLIDSPPPDRCGTCQACIDACPTNALVGPFQLNSNRCISYLTIEHRGTIAPGLTLKMKNWIFGCDICQDVCPWNRKARLSRHSFFAPRDGSWDLAELAKLLEGGFKKLFSGTALSRARRGGFLRNVIIALKNSGLPCEDFLLEASRDGEEAVAEQAKQMLSSPK